MITNSKQNWTVGSTVKVGFLTLKVRAVIATPGDYKPDAYLLTNMHGTKIYSFVPHNGISEVSPSEAQEMTEQNEKINANKITKAWGEVQKMNEVNAVFA